MQYESDIPINHLMMEVKTLLACDVDPTDRVAVAEFLASENRSESYIAGIVAVALEQQAAQRERNAAHDAEDAANQEKWSAARKIQKEATP